MVDRIYASLDEFRALVNDLKAQFETSSATTNEIRASLVELHDLRGTVANITKSEIARRDLHGDLTHCHLDIELYLSPNGEWTKSTEMKDVINTLEIEHSKGATCVSRQLLIHRVFTRYIQRSKSSISYVTVLERLEAN